MTNAIWHGLKLVVTPLHCLSALYCSACYYHWNTWDHAGSLSRGSKLLSSMLSFCHVEILCTQRKCLVVLETCADIVHSKCLVVLATGADGHVMYLQLTD
ncbi:hypothetical protein BsWGS_19666 [Bradybaena similaris]